METLIRCLVIDDDEDFADEAGALLKRAKMDVEVHYLGVTAIASLLSDPRPTVLVADLGLPTINGWGIVQLAAEMRRRNYPVTVLIVSGNADIESFRQAISTGVQDYLVKPVEPEMLVNSVTKAAGALDALIEVRERAVDAERQANRAWFFSNWLQCYAFIDRAFPEQCRGDGHVRMMLYLFTETSRGAQVGVSSACYASGLPFSTALRRLQDLIDAGLVAKRSDDQDGRRQMLFVTSDGERAMDMVWRCGRPAPGERTLSANGDRRSGL